MVMRSLVEMAGRDVELVDGVKVPYPDGWVLALPDPEEPVTHVWAESSSEGGPPLAQEYARRIRQLSGERAPDRHCGATVACA
jgi:mannose-1-phosphate guanylyltransferase / phosphomannomutase